MEKDQQNDHQLKPLTSLGQHDMHESRLAFMGKKVNDLVERVNILLGQAEKAAMEAMGTQLRLEAVEAQLREAREALKLS